MDKTALEETLSRSLNSSFKEWGDTLDSTTKVTAGSKLAKCCKCFKKKKQWEPAPQENVFKSNEVAETKDPKMYRILECKFWDALFVFSCLASVFLFTFCEGFMIQSRVLWGIIHSVNALYAILLLLQWVTIVLKSKYSQSSFTKVDVILSLLSLLPIDLIVLLVHSLNNDDATPEEQANNQETHLTFTLSRLHYILRIKNILNYLAGWENQLILGDFYSFLLRILLYTTFLLHFYACVWHRIACNSIRPKHFLMEPSKAREELCYADSWIMKLQAKSEAQNATHFTPFLNTGYDTSILWNHYAASLYWAASTALRMGYGDIEINITSNYEVVWTALVQIVSWIFVLAVVSGTLTSLLIESDTERESYLTRRFAIQHYLSFSTVSKSVVHEVNKFYDYLWNKRKGVSELQLVEFMPAALKAEIFFDIHKFVLEQMPLFQDLEVSFLMTLSVRMTHSFHLTGETMFRRNDRGNHMYYVLKGHLEIMSADESHPIACIKSGSAIGDIFLVHPYSHASTVRCGSECDVLALTRESVKEVLKDYPQYSDILQARAQERFDHCVLLLSLSKRYNEAPKFFDRLPYEMPMPDVMTAEKELEEETKAMNQVSNLNDNILADADGLSLASTLVKKLSSALNLALAKKDKKFDKRRRSVQEEAYSAFAADVNRTLLLAKDLGIGRAPLTITTPPTIVTRDSKDNVISGDNETIFMKLKHMPILSGEERSEIFLCWKLFVSLCTCLVLFYYPFQFAFRDEERRLNVKYDGIMHLADLIFCIDFFFDMLQIVVTPQKTLENVNEILSYRVRSFTFYFRLIAFIPLEYMLAPALGIDYGDSAYYYLLKSNRFLEFLVLRQFFQDLEGVTRIPIMAVFITRFLFILFFVIHFFAVCYEFVLRDFIPDIIPDGTTKHMGEVGKDYEQYGFVLYWSTQVVTTAGFGDISYFYDVEVLILCGAFISGTLVTTYLGAKLAAILANAQRRRITFTQIYYGVTAFLRHRKFPEDLSRRIKAYYQMQWKAHEGVLIPKERSAIWDAPEAIISEVALSQALKYITRVPLVKHTSENVLRNMCSSLKQYFVPPDECVLFEGDKRRELYIIVKGFCNVYRGSQFIGHLSEGNYFGLSGLIMGVNLDYRITTETHCLFFCLQFDDFVEIAKKHKFLRKDYRLLRGETPFEKLDNIVTKWDTCSLKDGTVAKQHELSVSEIDMDGVPKESINKTLSSIIRLLLMRTTFLPSGRFISCWVVIRVIAAAAVSYYVLAQVSFDFDPETTFLAILVFDIIAWMDMYIMLHVAYHNELNQLVTDPLKTARNYVTGSFVLDLLTCFPLDYLYILCYPGIHVFPSDEYHYMGEYPVISVLRLNRFFQIYRLIQLGVTLNKTISKSLTFITLLEVIPWMLVSIHVLACISVGVVCSVAPNGDYFTCSKNAWLTHGSMYDIEGTKNTTGPDLQSPVKLYVIAFYWTISTALCVGFGDIDLLNMQNRLIAVFVIISGIMVTTYLSSKLTACMVGEDSRRIEIRTKIDIMYEFLDRYKASRSVKRRVKEIYYNEWEKTKGISVDHLFGALHPSLKADVVSHLYEDSIRRSPLLKTLDEPGVRMLASILKEVFLVEGEYIFKYGNITDDVFLVASGIVSAYNVKGEVMSYMGAGSLIGEISALYGVNRLYTAVAATDVDILVFNAEDFLDFLELYPDLKDQLEQLCENMGQDQEGFLGPPVDVVYPSEASALDPYTRLENTISTSSPRQRVRKNARVPKAQSEDSQYADTSLVIVAASGTGMSQIESRNPMCVLDPLRVPLRHGQLNDEEKELMLQDSGSDKKWWSVFVTFGRVPKTEMGTLLHIFQDKKRCNVFNFTIHPASPITRGSGWCVFNLLITAISCALTAYEISFTSNDAGESWPIAVLRYFAELFFVTRIIGNFHLGFVDDSGVLITDVKKISKRYCTSFDGFILDMTTTLPIYCISYIIGGPKKYVYAANIRGIQLLRVVLFVRYLGETDNDLRMKASEVKILKITILLCFIFHFCACAWYLVACYGMTCNPDSWMTILLDGLISEKRIGSTDDISIASRYFISLYYVTTTITSTGFNNVTPRTIIELIVTVGFIFGTVFVIGYLLGEMTQCLASQISRKIHYEHELSVVESHLAGLGLNKSKRDIVADYYKLVWKRFRGMPYYSLLRELPYPLRADICFEIYESNLKNSRVLGTVDDQVLRQLTARIRHEFYLPGGHIVRGGNVCDAMYFVKRGEILIIDENMGIELCVETLYENDCFGEIKILLPREAYRFSYVARIESEVGMLKRDDLDEVLKNFPGLRNELLDKVRNAKFHRHSDKDHDDMRGDRGKDDVRSRKSNFKKPGAAEKKMKPLDMKQAEIAKIETITVRQEKPNFVRNDMPLVPPKAPKLQQAKTDQQGKNLKDMKQSNVSKIETITAPQQYPYFTRNNLGTGVASPPRLQTQTRPPQVRKVEQRPMTSLRQVDPLNQAVQKGYSALIQGPQSHAIREVRSLPPYLSAQQTGLGTEVQNNLMTRTSLNGTAENPGTAQGQNPVLFEYIPRNPGKNSQQTGTTTRQRNPPKK